MEQVAQRRCDVPVFGDLETCLDTALGNVLLCMSGGVYTTFRTAGQPQSLCDSVIGMLGKPLPK